VILKKLMCDCEVVWSG